MMYYDSKCTRSEMDIMPAFEAVVPGSNPGGCTQKKKTPTKGVFFLCVHPRKLRGSFRPGFEDLEYTARSEASTV